MLLDFFATFFSSATALLPIFAQDILHVGAQGYGWLYSAPAAGAFVGSLAMVRFAHRVERQGALLIWAVVGYGARDGRVRRVDGVLADVRVPGVVGRERRGEHGDPQSRPPARARPTTLRGRMTGINMVFFMGGPQLGELEAGAMANWLGARRLGRDRRDSACLPPRRWSPS